MKSSNLLTTTRLDPSPPPTKIPRQQSQSLSLPTPTYTPHLIHPLHISSVYRTTTHHNLSLSLSLLISEKRRGSVTRVTRLYTTRALSNNAIARKARGSTVTRVVCTWRACKRPGAGLREREGGVTTRVGNSNADSHARDESCIYRR